MANTVLDRLLETFPAAKRQTLRRMIGDRRVLVNGTPARSFKQPVEPTDSFEVIDRKASSGAAPGPNTVDPAGVEIIHEDEDILVVNKPPGLLTSTVPREPRATLLAQVREHVERRSRSGRIGLIHRLDRDASGLLVFSKNDRAYQSLKTQFFKHTVDRTYHAIVHGVPKPPEGTVRNRLVEKIDGKVHSTRDVRKGQEAITDYKTIATDGRQSLVRITLQTGRKHQIRVHLASRGSPIMGDRVYDATQRPAPRLMLAATHLTVEHPRTGQRMTFEIPLPPELRQATPTNAPTT